MSCSDDDEGSYGSLMKGEALFIDFYEDYRDGKNVSDGSIGTELSDDGQVVPHSSGYDLDWVSWRMSGNTIVITNSDGSVERYKVIRFDEETGEFVARCDFEDGSDIDYRLIFGEVDSDKYD